MVGTFAGHTHTFVTVCMDGHHMVSGCGVFEYLLKILILAPLPMPALLQKLNHVKIRLVNHLSKVSLTSTFSLDSDTRQVIIFRNGQ